MIFINFVGLVGVVREIADSEYGKIVRIGVSRPFASETDTDLLEVAFSDKIFKNDLEALKKNMVVGVKGRLENNPLRTNQIICERIQIF